MKRFFYRYGAIAVGMPLAIAVFQQGGHWQQVFTAWAICYLPADTLIWFVNKARQKGLREQGLFAD